MGLQSGDIVLSVNGHQLGTFDEIATAFTDLLEEVEFELSIWRPDGTGGGSIISKFYVIVQ